MVLEPAKIPSFRTRCYILDERKQDKILICSTSLTDIFCTYWSQDIFLVVGLIKVWKLGLIRSLGWRLHIVAWSRATCKLASLEPKCSTIWKSTFRPLGAGSKWSLRMQAHVCVCGNPRTPKRGGRFAWEGLSSHGHAAINTFTNHCLPVFLSYSCFCFFVFYIRLVHNSHPSGHAALPQQIFVAAMGVSPGRRRWKWKRWVDICRPCRWALASLPALTDFARLSIVPAFQTLVLARPLWRSEPAVRDTAQTRGLCKQEEECVGRHA